MWLLLYVAFLSTFVYSQRLSEEENIHLQETCGKAGQFHRIRRSMHTPQVARAAAPWVVRLELTTAWFPNMTIEDRKNITKGWCSGSLISPRHVLTAAHCVVDDEMETTCTSNGDILTTKIDPFNVGKISVRFTESCNLESCKWGGSFKDIHVPVKKAFVARTWTGENCQGLASDVEFRGDVAVLELAEDVPFWKHVFPACLNSRDLKESEPIEQFGYGYGPSVTDADLDLDELRNFKGKAERCRVPTPDVFCFIDDFASTCPGDSGSGLFVYNEEKRVRLVGPLSGGWGNCHVNLERQKQMPYSVLHVFSTLVKPNLYWICAATGICLNDDDLKQFKMYNEQGLSALWYKTFEELTGNDIYI